MNRFDKAAVTIPPHSERIEKAVIGSALFDLKDGARKCARLPAEYFFCAPAQAVHKAIIAYVETGQPPDALGIIASLKNKEHCAWALSALSAATTVTTLEYYVEKLKDLAYRREMFRMATAAETDDRPAAEIAAEVRERLDKLHGGPAVEKTRREKLESVADELVDLKKRGQEMSMGIPTMDNNVHGLRRKHLYILGGLPSAGKSGFALNIARRVALNDKKRVLFISLELSYFDCVCRIAAPILGIAAWKFRKPHYLTDDELRKFNSIFYLLENAPLEIACGVETLGEIRYKIKEYKPDLVILDHLQMLPDIDEKGSKFDKTYESLGRYLKSFRTDAEKNNYCFLALSQIGREHSRSTKNPDMCWFQGSSKIEQTADAAMIIHNPDPTIRHLPELWLVKMRNGTAGVGQCVKMAFDEDKLEYTEIY